MTLTQKFIEIPLDKLDPSPWNPRRLRETDPHLLELAASIKAVGLKQPILARPIKVGGRVRRWQIVAGHRRAKACSLAERTAVAALVEELTDDEARELTVLENLQREDLEPLEEAAGIQTLLDQPHATLETVADRLGKPYSWVARRAKLSQLTSKWQEGADNVDSPLHRWPVTWLEEIAILDPGLQQKIFEENSEVEWEFLQSLKELKRFVGEYLQLLRNASWDLADATLCEAAGACDHCPKRISQQNYLFPDLHEEGNDRCLDPDCWDKKKAAFVLSQRRELVQQYSVPPIEITINYPAKGKHVVTDWDARNRECRKGTRGAVPALRVDGPQAGQTLWLKPDDAKKQTKPKQTEDEKREELEEKRYRRAIELLCKLIESEGVHPAHDELCQLIVAFGTEWTYVGNSAWDAFASVDMDLIDQSLWAKVWPTVSQWLRRGEGGERWDPAKEIAEMCDVDPFGCFNQAKEELPFEGKAKKGKGARGEGSGARKKGGATAK